jgi:hypothetical protein
MFPSGAFGSFAGVTDEDDERVERMARGLDDAVGAQADEITAGGEELEDECYRMRFGESAMLLTKRPASPWNAASLSSIGGYGRGGAASASSGSPGASGP